MENGEINHGSRDKVEDTGDDDDGLVGGRDVGGKLDMGKSGFIFNVLASAFSCRRHFARRF